MSLRKDSWGLVVAVIVLILRVCLRASEYNEASCGAVDTRMQFCGLS